MQSTSFALLSYHISSLYSFITRRRSYSFAEYCKHCLARLNGVHTFGCKSVGSEPSWIKFGQLRSHCLPLVLADFGCDFRPRDIVFGGMLASVNSVKNDYQSRKLTTDCPAYGTLAFHLYRWKESTRGHSPGLQPGHKERHSSTSLALLSSALDVISQIHSRYGAT